MHPRFDSEYPDHFFGGNMAEGKTSISIGPGLGTLTFLVLLVLKLTGLANMTWFWVFFPLWIIPAVFIVFLFVVLLLGAFADSR
jgi:hypothetical protein